MSIAQYHNAELNKTSLNQLQALEQELGVILVAIEPDPEPARLSEQQLRQVQALEAQTGKVLVAYEQR